MSMPMMLIEYCLECGYLAEIEIVGGDIAQMRVLRTLNQGRGIMPHLRGVEILNPCGPWGIATAVIMSEDPLDIIAPSIARFTRVEGDLRILRDK